MKSRTGINLHKSFANASDRERNEVAKAFEPLVSKLVNQFYKSVDMSWDELKCMAYEGLVKAMNTFDPTQSKLNFTQFAAYAIRYNMLNSITREAHAVKMTSYGMSEIKKAGKSGFISVSLDNYTSYSNTPAEMKIGAYYTPKFANGNVFDYMYDELGGKFSDVELDIFYSYFGLNGRDETKLKDIAKGHGISSSRASQHLGKVLRYIRNDENMLEMLSQLISR